MMRKNIVKLANLVLKNSDEEFDTPQSVIQEIRSNSLLKFLMDMLTPKELVIISFLTILIKNGKYQEGTELLIDQFLFSYSIIQFEEQTEQVDCDYCDGDGTLSCDTCFGDGYIDCSQCGGSGSDTCSTCDGEGEDDEGNYCNDCQGGGQVDCGECDGDGKIECDSCGGDGDHNCYDCDGVGHKEFESHIPFRVTTYLSWNPKFREKLRQLSDSEKNIGRNYKLDPHLSMRTRISNLNHEDLETYDIGEEYQNGTYVGGIEENPEVFTYGNDIWVKDPTPDEKFKG